MMMNPMLTIFSVPKAFQGHADVIQRNAVESWLRLEPRPEIILCGGEDGVDAVCAEYGLRHLPDGTCNEYGTPLLHSVFASVAGVAKGDNLCFVNADILLFQDLPDALSRILLPRFLLMGRRWDLAVEERIDFSRTEWQNLRTAGVRHAPRGSDYFLFPRSVSFDSMPAFAVGRPKWDQWMVRYAKESGIPVVDATRMVHPIHQNHAYPHAESNAYREEVRRNQSLAGDVDSIVSGTHILTSAGLVPVFIPLSHSYLRLHRWAARSSLTRPLRILLSRS